MSKNFYNYIIEAHVKRGDHASADRFRKMRAERIHNQLNDYVSINRFADKVPLYSDQNQTNVKQH